MVSIKDIYDYAVERGIENHPLYVHLIKEQIDELKGKSAVDYVIDLFIEDGLISSVMGSVSDVSKSIKQRCDIKEKERY